jgi:hypothetical protein
MTFVWPSEKRVPNIRELGAVVATISNLGVLQRDPNEGPRDKSTSSPSYNIRKFIHHSAFQLHNTVLFFSPLGP